MKVGDFIFTTMAIEFFNVLASKYVSKSVFGVFDDIVLDIRMEIGLIAFESSRVVDFCFYDLHSDGGLASSSVNCDH